MKANQPTVEGFHKGIRSWFRLHQRDLPWRKTRNPYHIVVSEFMLQQTQVDRVIPKYMAFIASFPTWESLADAQLHAVLMAWSGLGYNRRARHLQLLAQTVVKKHGGKLPDTEAELLTLPGIGPYTAKAILVFAFGKRAAPKDTNIARVTRRYFFGEKHIPTGQLDTQITTALPRQGTYWWNHALMDFGALQCTARMPKCANCPLRFTCSAAPHFLAGGREVVVKQKASIAFTNSLRFLRGRILKALLEKKYTEAALVQKLERETAKPAERIVLALDGLVKDGLLKRAGNRISIPGPR